LRVTNALRLSHLEFDILWEQLGLGERPYPISVGTFGATVDDRAVLREQVFKGLADKGMHDGRDLHPRLEDLLIMLVRNQFTIDGQLSVGQHLQVLAAGRNEHGLLAVQTDEELHLRQVRATSLVDAVVGLLPEEKPGPGGPVTLPKSLFDEAAQAYQSGGYAGFEMAMTRGGVTGRGLRTLSTLVESGRHGGGQLAANSADRMGRRARSPVLNWFDTDAGRYIVYEEPRRDRQDLLTFTPGDSGRIAQRLTDLVRNVNQ
jgi:hypothetical protein